MAFKKVSREHIDVKRVTLHLRKAEGGERVARVATLAYNEENAVEMMEMGFTDAEMPEAIAFAVKLAAFK